MRIGFIGIGKLGKEVAEVMYDVGHEVEGYDIQFKTDYIKFPMKYDLREVCENKEIIFVALPTPHHPDYGGTKPSSHLNPSDFDYHPLKNLLHELNQFVRQNQLVVLISTVLPGITRTRLATLAHTYRFIYNPYLIAMGTVKEDMVKPEMVIIGTEDGDETGDAKILVDFYKTIVHPDTRFEIGTWDEAEAIKIFYNTFISAKLSIVNMIQDVAEKNGFINTDIVTQALEKSTYRITGKQYMKAGMGDGGPCHPRDNIALRSLSKNLSLGYDLFNSIIESREGQAKNMAIRLVELSFEYNLPIIIMGETYKPNVEYTDGSYSKLIGYYITEIFRQPLEYDKIEKPSIFLLGHREVFNNTIFPEGSVVLDPWRERNNNDTIYYGGKRK